MNCELSLLSIAKDHHKQGGPVVLDVVAPHPDQGKELADGGLEHRALGKEVYSTQSSW